MNLTWLTGNKLINLSVLQLTGLFYVINLSLALIINTLIMFGVFEVTFEIEPHPIMNSPIPRLIVSIIIGPVVETWLFFHLISKIFHKFKTNSPVPYLTSALLFGLSHFQAIVYIIMTFFAGIIYYEFYTIMKVKRKNAFWLTSLLHSMHNLSAVVILHLVDDFNL